MQNNFKNIVKKSKINFEKSVLLSYYFFHFHAILFSAILFSIYFKKLIDCKKQKNK